MDTNTATGSGQSISTVQLGQPYGAIVASLGPPIQEEMQGDLRILWYGSNAPTLADFIYLKGNVVVFLSKSSYTGQVTLDSYLKQYGTPVQSVARYQPGIHDSLRLTAHVWPEKGIAVTSVGVFTNGRVIRTDTFAPMTVQDYFATWGKDIASNTAVVITSPTPIVTPTPSVTGAVEVSLTPLGILFVVVIILVPVVVGVIVWRKFRKKRVVI